MRILHTSDWHVGKTLRGRSRLEEHDAVLAEITGIAEDRDVDVVLVVGDLFESAAPPAEAEEVVYRHLLGLAHTGATVAVVAGNHDNPRRLAAITPLLELGKVLLVAEPRRADQGGVRPLTVGDGEQLNLALLPFVSKRGVVKAADLMATDAPDQTARYAERLRQVIDALADAFTFDAVNVMAAHCMVTGGTLGGGERSAHTVFEYAINATAFPSSAHYVALGHLHHPQQVPGPCPIWYSGSPLQLDFGETDDDTSVLMVDVESGSPAEVTSVPLSAGRRLRTLRGSLGQLRELAEDVEDEHVKVVVEESPRPGLAEEVRELLPDAVDIEVPRPEVAATRDRPSRGDRSPGELLRDYLTERDEADDRVIRLFDELLDEVTGAA